MHRTFSSMAKKVPVTHNLFEALSSLRLRDMDRLLWIDALCINQHDHREKGHQVGQMRSVYHNADTVLVWLGPSSDAIDDIMDMMALWDKQFNTVPQTLPNIETAWSKKLAQLGGTSNAIYQGRVATFARLVERPWFRRVWIIQEVANARVALILCGSKVVTSRIFSTVHHFLDMEETHPHTKAVMEVMPGPLRRQSWWNDDRRLATLLLKFSGSEATKVHDRIYALLGIASDASGLPIDYARPFQDVVHQTISLLTLGDAGLSRLLTKPLLFEHVFMGVTSINELIMRVFESALQNSEGAFLRRLALAPPIKAVSRDSISKYAWTNTYFQLVFGLYVGADFHNGSTLADICKSALEWHHYFVCDEIFQMVEFKPTNRGAGGDLIPDDRYLARVAAEDKNSTILGIMLDRLKAANAEGLGSFAMSMLSLMGICDSFSASDENGMRVLQTALGCGADIKASDPKWGMALLMRAIRFKGPETVRLLVVGGADLTWRGADHGTPLHFAESIDGEYRRGRLNARNTRNTKRRSKAQMQDLLLDVCAEDRHLYAGLLEGREEVNDTGGHSEKASNSKRAREDGDGVGGVGEPRKSRRGRR
ncbi:hypothetical protein PG997_000149 [Apiospora hydei]|uniref:Heterokaryon incompatibility domain-containing protein n=1 Tax=Apiospora hydei TaxID=1337664 RepID=A0ABR1XA05_9PEZI